MKQSSRKDLTLIELLVVIAIIIILTAIMFPVFAQGREGALHGRLREVGEGFQAIQQRTELSGIKNSR